MAVALKGVMQRIEFSFDSHNTYKVGSGNLPDEAESTVVFLAVSTIEGMGERVTKS